MRSHRMKGKCMNQERFSVYFSKKDAIWFGIALVVIVAACCAACMIPGTREWIIILIAIFYLIIFGRAILKTLLFKVDIIGSTIKVHTHMSKHYQFECSEIEKVVCSKRNSAKLGPQFSIEINTDKYSVCLPHGVIGFEEMAGYLLEKYESGEIKESAISKSCKKTLANHRDYVHTENLKKKK